MSCLEEPDQIIVHRAAIWTEPVDQRLDVELCRFAAHRMPAIDVERFAGRQGVGGLLDGQSRAPLKGFAARDLIRRRRK